MMNMTKKTYIGVVVITTNMEGTHRAVAPEGKAMLDKVLAEMEGGHPVPEFMLLDGAAVRQRFTSNGAGAYAEHALLSPLWARCVLVMPIETARKFAPHSMRTEHPAFQAENHLELIGEGDQ